MENFLHYEKRKIKGIIIPHMDIMLSYQQRACRCILSYLSLTEPIACEVTRIGITIYHRGENIVTLETHDSILYSKNGLHFLISFFFFFTTILSILSKSKKAKTSRQVGKRLSLPYACLLCSVLLPFLMLQYESEDAEIKHPTRKIWQLSNYLFLIDLY